MRAVLSPTKGVSPTAAADADAHCVVVNERGLLGVGVVVELCLLTLLLNRVCVCLCLWGPHEPSQSEHYM
jgi:hypothetical protein